MKKIGKQLLVIGCTLGILVLGICSLMNGQVRQMYAQLDGAVDGNIPDGVYHVTADGSRDYSTDAEGQYLVLKFWSYETFDKDAVNQMAIGDILYVRGEPLEVHTLERSENSLGQTIYVNINGGMAEDGITLAYDYEEGCFRESAENDSYVLYSIGSRKVKLAENFLYADHSSVATPGDPEPDWARGDAAAFPAFIVGRELYCTSNGCHR